MFHLLIHKNKINIKVNSFVNNIRQKKKVKMSSKLVVEETKIPSTPPPHFNFSSHSMKEIAHFFYKYGFVIIDNVLTKEELTAIKNDLAYANQDSLKYMKDFERKKLEKDHKHIVHKRFFEKSNATLKTATEGPLVEFAEYVISDVPSTAPPGSNSLFAHMIHNNAFTVPPNGRGQAPTWHVDDPLQQIIIDDGTPLPQNIRLPVLLATYMIWLSDCTTPENGPTFVVPGSHRWGRPLNKDEANKKEVPMCGKAGTAVLINPNLWHRGANNTSSISRETLQITYARRIIGHKYGTIMNYHMPKHVYENKSEKIKQRLGFLQGGAYS